MSCTGEERGCGTFVPDPTVSCTNLAPCLELRKGFYSQPSLARPLDPFPRPGRLPLRSLGGEGDVALVLATATEPKADLAF